MISKNKIKFITGLKQKKYREKHGLFVAEGPKIISELKEGGLQLHSFYTIDEKEVFDENHFYVTQAELQKISFLKTANMSLAVFKIPEIKQIESTGLTVVLDAVRDPGNLGTIIRLCDWFGVSQLVCSTDTTDCYSPKVVQATMGSMARVAVHYVDIENYLKTTSLPIYGAFMDGKSVYSKQLRQDALIVMGNEANGISKPIEELISEKITIPQFGHQTTESLNVATATAILLSEARRFTEM
ncbi:TrmH family RNA methyltransferase [Marixanthomonas spongiae]|uniref:RNA methyltransferase n=1 Tax=Marixanthomonas spongiae TaxID=2174845 RepID=A0A2U0I7I5_9FLAO|nr:RNA methyltransferase [Marixanthomonas spongiae]PVW17051.1 RNA methyltransferase [Marixanthomonas spongiae]